MAQSDNHPDPKTRQGQQHRQEQAPHQSTVPSGQNAGKASAPQNNDTSLSILLNMAFGRNTQHAQQCRRSPPTLLPASQEKIRLTEQCSSRWICRMHSTMWIINN